VGLVRAEDAKPNRTKTTRRPSTPNNSGFYRPDAKGQLKWQGLRRGIADLWRRGQVSLAANGRYLEALASVTGRTPLYKEAQTVCCPVFIKGKRYRALNPWSAEDGALLEAISRGEFTLNGFRNRDLRKLLYPSTIKLVNVVGSLPL
jgi:hypothetical protein